MTTLTHLECSRCGRHYDATKIQSVCECKGALLARYDLERTRLGWSREWLGHAPSTIWRYAPLLPVGEPASIVSLGEGMTPLLRAARLGRRLGCGELWIKDEGLNPAATVEARGFSCSISMAVERGLSEVTASCGADAAAALAAYAAAAGIRAHINLPPDVGPVYALLARACGAEVVLEAAAGDVFSVAAFEEPYHLEGIKTLGLEIAEQFRWTLPEVIVVPAGSGSMLTGIWKAFEELEAVGWISSARPRMVAVQAEGCAPIVEAFRRGADDCEPWPLPSTLAPMLRVPAPPAGAIVLRILRQSRGAAVAVGDQQMLEAGLELARTEGILPSPEGGACLAALRRLIEDGAVAPQERVLICNPVAGYMEAPVWSTRFPRELPGEQDKLGGLITPR